MCKYGKSACFWVDYSTAYPAVTIWYRQTNYDRKFVEITGFSSHYAITLSFCLWVQKHVGKIEIKCKSIPHFGMTKAAEFLEVLSDEREKGRKERKSFWYNIEKTGFLHVSTANGRDTQNILAFFRVFFLFTVHVLYDIDEILQQDEMIFFPSSIKKRLFFCL